MAARSLSPFVMCIFLLLRRLPAFFFVADPLALTRRDPLFLSRVSFGCGIGFGVFSLGVVVSR